MIEAICTWGEGPDVLISLNGTELFLLEKPYKHKPPQGSSKYGHVKRGHVDLRVDQAMKLAADITLAAKQAIKMDESLAELEGQVISVANLPEKVAIKDPFDKDFLMGLPKEALVATILRIKEEMA